MNQNKNLLSFIQIGFETNLYTQEVTLREQYLRKPLGLTLSESDVKDEEIQLHFGMMIGEELVACAVIKPIDQKRVKLRQMIVRPESQSSGIGSLLLNNVEKTLIGKGFETVELNARLAAVKFYEKNGFIQQGSPFIEVGIHHVLMSKTLNNMYKNRLITVGEPAPWFSSRCTSSERYHIDTVAGRYMVLAFFGTTNTNFGEKINAFAHTENDLFDDDNVCFFGVSNDSDDETQSKVSERIPGIRYFWDFDKKVSNLYKVINSDGILQETVYVLDPMLRVIGLFKFNAEAEDFSQLLNFLKSLPKIKPPHFATPQAPVLVIPHIFEPALCKALVDYYDRQGGEDSGFMREIDGKTVGILDYQHKRRRDCRIEDDALKTTCMNRIYDRLIPAVERAFQFKATRMERYVIGCYDANEQAHFRAHRDNTTPSTAHRKFAVSLFLNTGEYEGGFLKFPEFGSAHYIAPTGGAVVFSCSLLHEATRVTSGKRYMFLPFLYDDAAALIRQETASLIVDLVSENEDSI